MTVHQWRTNQWPARTSCPDAIRRPPTTRPRFPHPPRCRAALAGCSASRCRCCRSRRRGRFPPPDKRARKIGARGQAIRNRTPVAPSAAARGWLAHEHERVAEAPNLDCCPGIYGSSLPRRAPNCVNCELLFERRAATPRDRCYAAHLFADCSETENLLTRWNGMKMHRAPKRRGPRMTSGRGEWAPLPATTGTTDVHNVPVDLAHAHPRR